MERIIKFFFVNKTIFVFLLCLILSSALIFSNQTDEAIKLRALFVDLSSSITKKLNWFSLLFTALEENKRLLEENHRLNMEKALNYELREQNNRLRDLLEFQQLTNFEFRTGNIIQWITPLHSMVTIDIGENDGVNKNDPVITSNGLVGKIIDAGNHSAICQLLTDADFRASAQIRNSEITGFLEFKEDNFAIMEIKGSAEVAVGDSVVTSKHGNIYPDGIPIGTVAHFTTDPGLFKTVTVKLFVNYASLKEVSVIVNVDSAKISW